MTIVFPLLLWLFFSRPLCCLPSVDGAKGKMGDNYCMSFCLCTFFEQLHRCWDEVIFHSVTEFWRFSDAILNLFGFTQAQKLEKREDEMKKRDALYKEHIEKLETKCAQFDKVTADSFQKSKEETHNRFARFNIQPVCGDLQSQIFKCYQENPGKSLSCSGIASAYMQCVNQAKVDKMSTRG